jgi:two-component system chemotaxis response regulator CheB
MAGVVVVGRRIQPRNPEVEITRRPPAIAGLIAVGASTGGPGAVAHSLAGLNPERSPPVLLVQHTTVGFTEGLVEWLQRQLRVRVLLAQPGVTPLPGHVYVAPDDHHLLLGEDGRLRLDRSAPFDHHRPSATVLFRSVAQHGGHDAVGVLLSGMGADGAEGLQRMSERGAFTIAQEPGTCLVDSMPKSAIERGAVRLIAAPERIRFTLSGLRATRTALAEPRPA